MKKIRKMNNRKGEGYVGSGVKILIAVVLGALLLSGLYALQKNVIIQGASNKVEELFDYGQNTVNLSQGSECYETRSQSGYRVYDGEEFFLISGVMYDDYQCTTIDDLEVSSEYGDLSVGTTEPGWSMVSLSSAYIRNIAPGVHTVKVYDKNGDYSVATFEKCE